jgi:hypothetical protein
MSTEHAESAIPDATTKRKPDRPFTHEEAVVWLEDTSGLKYVREKVDTSCNFRRGRPRFGTGRRPDPGGRLVGYSVLTKDAPHHQTKGYFRRRLFWLAPWDHPNPGPYAGDDTGCPCEAVVPRSVRPNEPSERPARASRGRTDQTSHPPAGR